MKLPIYVYETIPLKPGEEPRRFEALQKASEEPLTHDPETGEPCQKVVAVNIVTKRKAVNRGRNVDKSSAAATACGCGTNLAEGHHSHGHRGNQSSSGLNVRTHSFGHKKHRHKSASDSDLA